MASRIARSAKDISIILDRECDYLKFEEWINNARSSSMNYIVEHMGVASNNCDEVRELPNAE